MDTTQTDYPALWQSEDGPESKVVDPRDQSRAAYWGDDHVNPLFRPTVQKLYQKLWGMKTLHDQDNRVHILGRLAVELDPPHLAGLLHELQGRLWYKLGYIDASKRRDWPVLHFADAKWPWQWGEEPPLTPLEVGTEVHEAIEVFNPWGEGNHAVMVGGFGGGAPSLEPDERRLDRAAAAKNKMLDIIKRHFPVDNPEDGSGDINCGCGKSFHTSTEWANHLRMKLDGE